MSFEDRLSKAIQRGERERQAKNHAMAERVLTEEEFRALHNQSRLELSEHITACLKKVVDHFPAFDLTEIVTTDGWGAKISMDELAPGSGKGLTRFFSHLILNVTPFSKSHILEIQGRGSIRNREVIQRTYFQLLTEIDRELLLQTVDQWVLEYAEKFSAMHA